MADNNPPRATGERAQAPITNQKPAERVATVRARPVVVREKPQPKEQPDLVRVRALERGQYGLDVDIIIRNPGEVFDMATSAMRTWPLGRGEHPVADAVIIETVKGQFELPGWVELVEEDDAISADSLTSHGHKGVFRNEDSRNIDVL